MSFIAVAPAFGLLAGAFKYGDEIIAVLPLNKIKDTAENLGTYVGDTVAGAKKLWYDEAGTLDYTELHDGFEWFVAKFTGWGPFGRGVAPVTKTVPNPGGRLGNAATRAKTQDVIQDLQSRGFTQIRQEVRFRPGSLGSGRERFADVVGRNPITGETEIIQIGRTIKSGPRGPIIRERHALDEIIFSPDIQNFPNTTIRFVDVNRPGAIQP